jgi:hypothetical protein
MARLATFHTVAEAIAYWTNSDNAEKFNNSLRWNGPTRRDYRARMFCAQGGTCVACGARMLEVMPDEHAAGCECGACHGTGCRCEWCDESAEFSHTVPATFHGVSRRGWLVTNVSLWHRKCNRENGERVARDLARPDLLHLGGTRDLPKF